MVHISEQPAPLKRGQRTGGYSAPSGRDLVLFLFRELHSRLLIFTPFGVVIFSIKKTLKELILYFFPVSCTYGYGYSPPSWL